jgi:zinc D-Ala-D-Ala carboxypeptidase|tara:strand:+ start:3616 stop:4080 length:465 start_codon:yes stop_codon:yes gene_type:complete
MVRLSKNFTLQEYTKSQTALRLGIDNNPSEEHLIKTKTLFDKVVQPVRDHFGVTVINSGYRGIKLNEAIGGSLNSQHCKGEAVDIECPGTSNYDVAIWIKDNLDFDQLILEFYTPGVLDSGWVHVSFTNSGNRKSVLTAMKENGKTVYKPGLIK